MNNSGGQSGLLIEASITAVGLQQRLCVIGRTLTEYRQMPGHDIVGLDGRYYCCSTVLKYSQGDIFWLMATLELTKSVFCSFPLSFVCKFPLLGFLFLRFPS